MQNLNHASQTIGALAEALAKAQATFPSIERNREVEVQTQKGSRYRFRYATLDAILEAVRKPLADNGLAVAQLIHAPDGRPHLRTLLIHGPSGEWVSADAPLPVAEGGLHELGSALTYLRRYSIAALLGLAPEEDDDGNHAQGNQARPQRSASGPRQAAPRSNQAEDVDTQRAQVMQKIGAHLKRLQIQVPELRRYCIARFGPEPPQLDRGQVATLLKILQKLKDRSAWEAEYDRWTPEAPPPQDRAELVGSGPAGRRSGW